jgi:hypothetical protein
MTRARDFLYVTWPLRYYHRWRSNTDRHSYSQLSRFLSRDVCATMDEVNLAEDAFDDEGSAFYNHRIPSRIRSMWD